jgi:predicted naringenin-chalcone synthase
VYTVLESIATGNPPVTGTQAEAAAFMQRVESLPGPLRERIPMIYERSAIERRYSCVADYTADDAEAFSFFPRNWSLRPAPSTGERNRLYRESILPLVERVAREALERASVAPMEITHVVAVTCTGFFAPGIDVELVKRLGLPAHTQRTQIGFMGCYAAFNGLRVAHSFCQSHPDARVLLVCAELCTLHFQVEESLESAIVNALFSDGAAAAVLSARRADEARGGLAYAGSHALLDDDSAGDMTWDIGDTGFLMGLSPNVPRVIAHHLPVFMEGLLQPQGYLPSDVDFWAIHPGGRSIVERAQQVLALPDAAVHDSLDVLRLHGNMSSPTILFILKRFLERHHAARQAGQEGAGLGVAMAFGPGLTLEGCLWKRV